MNPGTPSPPPTEPAEWRCIIRGRELGPMTRDQLVLTLLHAQDPKAMVWRPGMAEWSSPLDVPELALIPSTSNSAADRRKVSNAKWNAVFMFAAFAAYMIMFLGSVAAGVFGRFIRNELKHGDEGGFVGAMALLVLVFFFAAIYVPLRWKVIKGLSPVYRWLGLIGGLGIMAELLFGLGIVAIAFAMK